MTNFNVEAQSKLSKEQNQKEVYTIYIISLWSQIYEKDHNSYDKSTILHQNTRHNC